MRIQGTVKAVHRAENVTVLTVMKTEEIKAVAFDSMNISEGDYLQIAGEIQEYKGEKEIVIKKAQVVE